MGSAAAAQAEHKSVPLDEELFQIVFKSDSDRRSANLETGNIRKAFAETLQPTKNDGYFRHSTTIPKTRSMHEERKSTRASH